MTPQAAFNYAAVLKSASKDVETFRKQRQDKQKSKWFIYILLS